MQNPCYFEGKASLKCINDNSGDKAQCGQFFENYKKCKKFWNDVFIARRQAGLKPYLPHPEDRAPFMAKYARTRKIPVTSDDDS